MTATMEEGGWLAGVDVLFQSFLPPRSIAPCATRFIHNPQHHELTTQTKGKRNHSHTSPKRNHQQTQAKIKIIGNSSTNPRTHRNVLFPAPIIPNNSHRPPTPQPRLKLPTQIPTQILKQIPRILHLLPQIKKLPSPIKHFPPNQPNQFLVQERKEQEKISLI
jgi:hypothetical protein